MKLFKVVVYAPEKHARKIRDVLAENGAGHIGNYDYCSFSCKGVGRFRPQEGTKPFIGNKGKVEEVIEERIETVVSDKNIKKVLRVVIDAHPYEEPAIDIFPLLNDKYLK